MGPVALITSWRVKTLGECHVMMKAEFATLWLQPENGKVCQEPREARKRKERFLFRFQREHGPANTLNADFYPPELGGNTFLLY